MRRIWCLPIGIAYLVFGVINAWDMLHWPHGGVAMLIPSALFLICGLMLAAAPFARRK